jgi:hypothetical protein
VYLLILSLFPIDQQQVRDLFSHWAASHLLARGNATKKLQGVSLTDSMNHSFCLPTLSDWKRIYFENKMATQ